MQRNDVIIRKGPGRAIVMPENRLLVGKNEAAALLSISPRALDYLIANKRLLVRRIGSRVLIPNTELKRFACADHPEPLVG